MTVAWKTRCQNFGMLGRLAIADHDVEAGGGQTPADCPADAAGGTRDNG
jgi:hypothetical protein